MDSERDRLDVLYQVNRRLATFTDLDELVRYATRRAREVFDAEGCSILLLDHHRNEFFFPIASQRESSSASAKKLSEIRFPADRGVAGWVLKEQQSTLVDDAVNDPRFYGQVDKQTLVQTRAILAAPLRTQSGAIGVIEVINPMREPLSTQDVEFLEALANDLAVAYEKTRLYQEVRDEAFDLRQVIDLAGLGMMGTGLMISAGAVLNHLALALPWSELASRPGMMAGLITMFAGVGLFILARRRRAHVARDTTIEHVNPPR